MHHHGGDWCLRNGGALALEVVVEEVGAVKEGNVISRVGVAERGHVVHLAYGVDRGREHLSGARDG